MSEGIIMKEVNSFKFASEGIKYAFKTQNNIKIQIALGILAIVLAFLFGFGPIEWVILLISICLVLSAELINTVFETIVDMHTSEYHPKAKITKDLSAAVVLLISLFVSLIGLILFIPHFLATFGLLK
jgi:diacylglycerol kinase